MKRDKLASELLPQEQSGSDLINRSLEANVRAERKKKLCGLDADSRVGGDLSGGCVIAWGRKSCNIPFFALGKD